MPDFRINDDWILNRISSQSNSFSDWLSNLMKTVEKSLEHAPPEIAEEIRKNKNFDSLKDLDEELALAQKELAKLGGFGKKISSFTLAKYINLLIILSEI